MKSSYPSLSRSPTRFTHLPNSELKSPAIEYWKTWARAAGAASDSATTGAAIRTSDFDECVMTRFLSVEPEEEIEPRGEGEAVRGARVELERLQVDVDAAEARIVPDRAGDRERAGRQRDRQEEQRIDEDRAPL